jgi:hypothetical protein
MAEELKLEILPSGRIRFKRGSKSHNECMIKVLSSVVEDPKIVEELTEFFKGSEDVELLIGDTILCG